VPHRRIFELLGIFGCLLGQTLMARPALANGAFPAVSQLVSDPADADHLVLRSTFGLLVTRDRGANWDWLCEGGLGYKDVQPPMAVLPGGVILLAVPDGISHGDAAGCDFGLAKGIDAAVLDLARVPAEAEGAVAVSLSGTSAQLWRTHDSGATFVPVGDPVNGFIPATVDVAASDPNVVYVSGLLGTQGMLLRSSDGGGSFEQFSVPDTTTSHRPFIAAIDPNDANTVYVRLDGEPSEIEVTRDGGKTFTAPLTTKVPALGLALSPDGSTIVASNSYDGTFRADASTLEFQKVACGGPSCLNFGAAGLFGCGDQRVDGFIVGRSDDLGATFQRVVDLTCIRGPVTCGADTSVGRSCPDTWLTIEEQIGATACAPPDVTPYTGCFAGAGGEGDASSGETGGSGGTGARGGTTGTTTGGGPTALGGTGPTTVAAGTGPRASPPNHRAGGGGGCHIELRRSDATAAWLLGGALGWLGWLRRRERARARGR
jgi:hypothetical protein